MEENLTPPINSRAAVGAAAEHRQRLGEAASGAGSGSAEKVEALNIFIISDAIVTLVSPRRHVGRSTMLIVFSYESKH